MRGWDCQFRNSFERFWHKWKAYILLYGIVEESFTYEPLALFENGNIFAMELVEVWGFPTRRERLQTEQDKTYYAVQDQTHNGHSQKTFCARSEGLPLS